MYNFDLLSPQVRENPYPLFSDLRAAHPVSTAAPYGLVAVSRYDDVRTVLDSPAFGSRPNNAPPLGDPEPFEASLLVAEPPARSKVRLLVRKAMSSELLERHERRVRASAHALVDRVLERDNLDLISLLALPLPAASMADLLAIPPARRSSYMRWATDALSPGPGAAGAERMKKLRSSMDGFVGYLAEMLTARRAEPGEDLLSALATVEDGGTKLTDAEILAAVLHLLLAGNEAAADLIGNTLLSLLQNGEVYRAVRADPSRIPTLIEETLRHNSPVLGALRVTSQSVNLGEQTIPSGAVVLALLASANRDASRFADADAFDLSRDASDHLAFGPSGQEALWAPRARLEARVAIEVLFDRLPDFGPGEGEIQWCSALLFRGPRMVPVAYTEADPSSEEATEIADPEDRA